MLCGYFRGKKFRKISQSSRITERREWKRRKSFFLPNCSSVRVWTCVFSLPVFPQFSPCRENRAPFEVCPTSRVGCFGKHPRNSRCVQRRENHLAKVNKKGKIALPEKKGKISVCVTWFSLNLAQNKAAAAIFYFSVFVRVSVCVCDWRLKPPKKKWRKKRGKTSFPFRVENTHQQKRWWRVERKGTRFWSEGAEPAGRRKD